MLDFDPRWHEPERPDLSRGSRGGGTDLRDRAPVDPRDVFVKSVDLPRGLERELVDVREHTYELRGSESRALATIGAFRVVDIDDLRERDRGNDLCVADLRHLRETGLVRALPLKGRGSAVVVLTDRGRDVLETHRRDRDDKARQAFYAGLSKPREMVHDSQVYRAYLRAAERVREEGGDIRRVRLDYELKREYQQFLQQRNRGRYDSDGRPDRENWEIAAWAREHELPYENGHVKFPDARIEYDARDGRSRVEDVEVLTVHYRGAMSASKARSGFSCYRGRSVRIGGPSGNRGGRPFDPRLAEELLR